MRAAMVDARSLLAQALEAEPSTIPDDADIETFDAWDSLAHLRLMACMEEALGRTLETEEILTITDLASVNRILKAAVKGPREGL
jgi:acyl carrier protein